MKKKKNLELELLNFEGPVLKAIALDDCFVIVDEDKNIIAIFDEAKLMSFVESKRVLTDYRGREWKYSEHHQDAKASPEKIEKFIKLSKDGKNNPGI